MKLLFDAYWLVKGPPSGKTVVREILQAWSREFPEDQINLLVREVDRVTVEDMDFVREGKMTLRTTRAPIHALAVVGMRIPDDVHAVISQNFTPIIPRRTIKATFLHDGIFRQYPEWFTAKERIYLRLATVSIRAANLVLTSTMTESKRIQKYFAHTKHKTHAVGLGIPSWVMGENLDERRQKPEIKPYLLTVGRLNVRKNIRALIQAFESTPSVERNFDLVVVGEPNGKAGDIAHASTSIRFMSGIGDSELRDLYNGAAGFVFPSLDEGFGLPLLEAANFGIPTAASDIEVFREIDLAHVYFNPRIPRSISEALCHLVELTTNGDLAGQAERFNRAQAKYNWTEVVRNMRHTLNAEGLLRCGAS